MAGALGMGLGLLLKAGMGYEREKHNQKLLQQQNEASLFHDIATKHPEMIAKSPEMQKAFKKYYGDDMLGPVTMMGQLRESAKQHAAGLFQPQEGAAPAGGAPNPMMTAPTIPTPAGPSGTSIVGPGGIPPTGATAADPRLRAETLKAFDLHGINDVNQRRAMLQQMGLPADWASPEGAAGTSDWHPAMRAIMGKADELRAELKKADDFMQSDEYDGLDEGHKKTIEHRYNMAQQQLLKLEEEARKPGMKAAETEAETPALIERKKEMAPVEVATAGAESGARKRAELAPDIVAGEVSRGAAISGAEASARIEVEYSPTGIRGAASRAAAEESARRVAAGQAPMTPREQAEVSRGYATELTTLSKAFDQLVEQPGWLEKQGISVVGGAAARQQAKNDWIARVNPDLAHRMGLTATPPPASGIRTDTTGKKWKVNAAGTGWEPADAGATAPTGR